MKNASFSQILIIVIVSIIIIGGEFYLAVFWNNKTRNKSTRRDGRIRRGKCAGRSI